MALTDYSIDTSGSPQDVQRKQALADALMKQGMDSSPAAGGKNGGMLTALNRGLAGALGGYQRGAAANEEQQGRETARQQLANGLMGADGKINPQAYLAAASNPWVNPQQIGAVGKVADWQHTSERDKVGDQHWNASFGLQKQADARAAAAEGRAAADDENTPYQYAPNPKFGQPGEPQFIDQYAAARSAAEASAPGAGGASLTPVYGVGSDGKPAMVQTTKTGTAIQTKLPEGFQISKEPIKIDAGTHWQLMDPQTRQVIGTIPKNLAEVENQKIQGEATGKAVTGLPQAIASADETLKSIELVRNHKGRGMLTTGAGGILPGIPGTEGRGFTTAVDQLKGKTFLTAFNQLRGGGAITDAEGNKATMALARLDRAQNHDDFESALNDLRDIVKSGVERAKTMAKGGPTAKPVPVEINGYKIEPQ